MPADLAAAGNFQTGRINVQSRWVTKGGSMRGFEVPPSSDLVMQAHSSKKRPCARLGATAASGLLRLMLLQCAFAVAYAAPPPKLVDPEITGTVTGEPPTDFIHPEDALKTNGSSVRTGEALADSPSLIDTPPVVPEARGSILEDQAPALTPDRAFLLQMDAQRLDLVSDNALGALDVTSQGIGRGRLPQDMMLPFSPTNSYIAAPFSTRPFDFRAIVRVSAVGEKTSLSSMDRNQPWRFGTYLSTTASASFGSPATGRFLVGDYTASVRLGGESESLGALDQQFALTGFYGLAKLQLSLSAQYAHSTGPDRDLGQAVDRDQVSLQANAAYLLSAKTSLALTVSQTISRYAEGISSDGLSTSLSLGRRISVKTTLGLNATLGAVTVDRGGSEQTFQQINVQGSYRPSSKLGVSASAGYETRQVGGTTAATPIFNGGLSYAIRPTTSLSLAATRSVASSAAQIDTNYTSTTIQASVAQSLGRRFSTSLALGHQNSVYETVGDAANSTSASREDRYYFLRSDLQMQVTDSLTASLAYSYGTNDSNERAFQSQQISLSGSYSF
jgi:hypothetical protein